MAREPRFRPVQRAKYLKCLKNRRFHRTPDVKPAQRVEEILERGLPWQQRESRSAGAELPALSEQRDRMVHDGATFRPAQTPQCPTGGHRGGTPKRVVAIIEERPKKHRLRDGRSQVLA